MPDNRSYGDMLRAEREYAGIDLATMSRRLHIRPDILSAIENRQFDRMPARGYSKNMVRAYARALGLDENMISDMYLDEVHLYEVGEPRNNHSSRTRFSTSLSEGFSAGRRSTRSRSFLDSGESSLSRSYSGRDVNNRSQRMSVNIDGTSSSRHFNTSASTSLDRSGNRSRYNRLDSGSERKSSNRRNSKVEHNKRGSRSSGSKGIAGNSVVGSLNSLITSIHRPSSPQDTRVNRSYETIGSTPPYARSSNGRSRTSLSLSSIGPTRLIIGAAIIIIAIIAIAIIITNTNKSVDDTPNIPISGLTDTSSPEDENQVSSTKVAPQSAKFIFEIAAGQDAWCEVFENGSDNAVLSEVMHGPTSRDYTVTGTLLFRTANPDAVTLSVDSLQVEPTKQSNSNYYAYTVDFSEILRKWREENDVNSSASNTSGYSGTTNASNTTNASMTTNASTTSNTKNNSST